MTSLSYLEATFGVHKETLTKAEAAEYAEKYAKHYSDLRFEELKARGARVGRSYSTEEWMAIQNFEEQRKRLKNKNE